MPCQLSAGLGIQTPQCCTPREDSLPGQLALELCFALALSIALALCLAHGQSRSWLRSRPRLSPLTEGPRPAPGAPWRRPRPARPAQGRSPPMAPPSGSSPSLQARRRGRALLLVLSLGPLLFQETRRLERNAFHLFPSALIYGGRQSPLKVAQVPP